MSLKDDISSIISDIEQNQGKISDNGKLVRAYQGNLDPLFDEKVSQLTDADARVDFQEHKVHINYFQKCINKLTGIYNFEIKRKWNKDGDTLAYYEKEMGINLGLHKSNKYFNCLNCVILEVYERDGELNLRSMPLDRFHVWTNNPLDPTEPTAYIKFVKNINLTQEEKRNFTYGVTYMVYTEDEFMTVNAFFPGSMRGEVKIDITEQKKNPLGFAPFVYISKDDLNLIPEKDTSAFSLAVSPSMDLTNANVAAWWQGHPFRVLKNISASAAKNIKANHHNILVLNREQNSDVDPVYEEHASTLDIGKLLELIKFKIEDWFFTKDCPVKKDGNADNKSGVAMMIDSVDTLENKKGQINYYQTAEFKLWRIIAKYHNWLVKNKLTEMDEDAPKKLVAENVKTEVDFELPSAEVEQANEIGEDNESPAEKISVNKDEEDDSSTES